MAKQSSSFLKQLKKHYQQIGKKGGEAGTGEAKARSSDQARAAVNARWEKRRQEQADKEAAEKLTPPESHGGDPGES